MLPIYMKQIRLLTCVLAVAISGIGFSCRPSKERRPSRYLIPEGYVGWVRINYRMKGAPALPIEDNYYLFKFPSTGLLETSSDIEYGAANDDYFYYCGDTRRKLKETAWGSGGMIWAGYNGWSENNFAERTGVYGGFFIGTEEQLNKFGSEKDENYQPKVGPVDKSKLTCVAQISFNYKGDGRRVSSFIVPPSSLLLAPPNQLDR